MKYNCVYVYCFQNYKYIYIYIDNLVVRYLLYLFAFFFNVINNILIIF